MTARKVITIRVNENILKELKKRENLFKTRNAIIEDILYRNTIKRRIKRPYK